MFIGDRLKKLRKQNNMTQNELGKLLNVTKVSVCCYEKNIRIPSLETLEDISEVFNVNPNYFLGKDIPVIMEDTPEYNYYISKEELEFLNNLKHNTNIYSQILKDPKRMSELIEKKLK